MEISENENDGVSTITSFSKVFQKLLINFFHATTLQKGVSSAVEQLSIERKSRQIDSWIAKVPLP